MVTFSQRAELVIRALKTEGFESRLHGIREERTISSVAHMHCILIALSVRSQCGSFGEGHIPHNRPPERFRQWFSVSVRIPSAILGGLVPCSLLPQVLLYSMALAIKISEVKNSSVCHDLVDVDDAEDKCCWGRFLSGHPSV